MELPTEFPSVNPLVIKNIITDVSFPSVNSSIRIFFYYKRIYRQKKNYRRNISVGDFVGILITDGICVLCRWKNFISKTVKSCSDISDDVLLGPFYYLNIQLAFISSITKLVLFKCKHIYILKILNSY